MDQSDKHLSLKFQSYLRDNGIVKNWILLDMIRFIISLAQLNKSFWSFALETVVYMINIVPSKSVDITLYEIWCNKKQILSYMRVWDTQHMWRELCQISLMTNLTSVYPKETIGYCFYHTLKQKLFVSKNAVFLRKRVSLKWKVVGVKLNLRSS